ncbi:GNAT family N-acetyltransferase [Kribbella sp. NPDC004536]|uniref:GNAT family N-acetyltransferase n=1 Tax=Kribbella sp. NPDC004536 TaxID=3364106 RepID=UPI0036C387F0
MNSAIWPEGVEARPLDKEDAYAWAELIAAGRRADGERAIDGLDGLIDELADPGLEPTALWTDDLMIGFGTVRSEPSVVDVDRVEIKGAVRPGFRRQGIGTALMRWLVGRAREIHTARYPDVPGEVTTTSITSSGGAAELLLGLGFEECRYLFDLRVTFGGAIPQAPLQDRFQLVPFEPTLDEALRRTHNELVVDHWGATPEDAESWTSSITGVPTFRGASSYLVMDGKQIASYVLGYERESEPGHRELIIGQLGTRHSHRGSGLARAALAKVLSEAAKAGYHCAHLRVDADRPDGALQLYEGLGFELENTWVTYRLLL